MVQGKVTIEPGAWVHLFDTSVGGKPAKQRLTLTNATPASGNWKASISMAACPWAMVGEGTCTKAKWRRF